MTYAWSYIQRMAELGLEFRPLGPKLTLGLLSWATCLDTDKSGGMVGSETGLPLGRDRVEGWRLGCSKLATLWDPTYLGQTCLFLWSSLKTCLPSTHPSRLLIPLHLYLDAFSQGSLFLLTLRLLKMNTKVLSLKIASEQITQTLPYPLDWTWLRPWSQQWPVSTSGTFQHPFPRMRMLVFAVALHH